jgi:GNAT superfamily N-acetyltransferase
MESPRLPELHGIPGLRFRTYADETDLEALVALRRDVNAELGVPDIPTIGSLRNEILDASHVDPHDDVVLAFVHDRPVASSLIEWSDTSAGQRLFHSRGWVDAAWRRRGIGGAMLARNEARLTQIARSQAHTLPPALTTWLEDGDVGAHVLFAQRGYAKVRVYRHMTRPHMDAIDLGRLPQGLEVRPIVPKLLPQLWDAMMEAFRDHFGGHDASPPAFRRWTQDPDLDLGLWAVAFDGDEIAAGVLGYVIPAENALLGYKRGWTDPVFTRRPWRRRGVAYALLGRCLLLLREAGMTSAQLDVDSRNANDALTLYQRHGFEVDHGSSEWHKPISPSV